jgi:DNA-binding CsgD family transcriptional regulator
MLMFMMRLPEAGRMADDLLADPDVPDPARVRAVSVAVTARGAQGRLDAALGLIEEDLYAVARRHRKEVPYGEIQLRMARFQVLYWAGRFRELDRFTAENLGLEIDYPPPSLSGILAGFRGGALLARGRAPLALVQLHRSSRALAESDWFGQRPLVEAMRSRAAVFAGAGEVAEEAMAAADVAFALDPLRGARVLPYLELSRAWLLAAQGSVAEAAERCLNLGMVLEHTALPLAVEVLHAAARLGRPADAVDGLARLAAAVDGPGAAAALAHAQGLAAGDGKLLAAAGAALEEMGAALVAAEAQRSASNAFRRAGLGASTAAAARRATELLRRCGTVASPGLEPEVGPGEPLTDREREVARLAARGLTSPEIASELFLSVRTVDTHLSRVYRKLMIEGRRELAAALGLGPTSGT